MDAQRLIATDLTMLDPVALQQFALEAQAALIAAAPVPQPVQGEAVAWQCRYIDPDEGPGMWRHCEPENVAVFNARGSRYETRALYTQPPAPAVVDGKCRHMRTMDQICDPCARYPTPAVQIAAPGDVEPAIACALRFCDENDRLRERLNDPPAHISGAIRTIIAALRSQGQVVAGEAYKCEQARIVGWWNCQCAECRARAEANTIGTAALAQQANKDQP